MLRLLYYTLFKIVSPCYSVAGYTLNYDNYYINLRNYIYYNVMVNISMCYSNPTIVNMYWHYRKLVYIYMITMLHHKWSLHEFYLVVTSSSDSKERGRSDSVNDLAYMIGTYVAVQWLLEFWKEKIMIEMRFSSLGAS